MWIRMTLGIGILTLAYFFKVFGANLGLIILICSSLINYQTYLDIFEASYYTGKQNFPELIKELLGKRILKIFRVTYMIDLVSSIMIYSIVSWNLFEYCLWFFSLTKPEWILDTNKVNFDENHHEIRMIRYIFFTCMFFFTIPLFLKRSLDDFQLITALFLLFLAILSCWIIIELPFFYLAY